MNPLQPEKEFILRCMKALVLREGTCVQLNSSFAQKLDWGWILRTSYRHRLLGFVAWILRKKNMKNLDHVIQAKLEVELLKSRKRNECRQQQFEEANKILNASSIPVIPLKGVALTHLIYEDVPLREMSDIDILVQQSDLNESFRLLAQAGFRYCDIPRSKNRWQEKILAETHSLGESSILGRVPLFRDDIFLDVHFNPRYRIEKKYIEMDVAGIWQRARSFPKLGSNVFMLDPKDLIHHLLLHTVEYYSPRLIQLLDTACVIEKYNMTPSDILDQINVAPGSPSPALNAFVEAIQELVSVEPGVADFSPETTEVFERFFSRKSIPNEPPESFIRTEDSFLGIAMFRKIRSPWKRLIFIAGYLLPNPDYYGHNGSKVLYLRHWWALISKVWRLGRSKFRKPNL